MAAPRSLFALSQCSRALSLATVPPIPDAGCVPAAQAETCPQRGHLMKQRAKAITEDTPDSAHPCTGQLFAMKALLLSHLPCGPPRFVPWVLSDCRGSMWHLRPHFRVGREIRAPSGGQRAVSLTEMASSRRKPWEKRGKSHLAF